MTMSSLEDLVQLSRRKGPAKPTFGYYRQPNGWITVSPVTDLEELKYLREGWQRLAKYGEFEMNTEYAADHPLEALLMNGGVKELCAEQILETGLYLNPPLVPTCGQRLTQYHKRHTAECMEDAEPMVFPQLAGRSDVGPFECSFCGEQRATAKSRDKHESIIHKDERSDTRTGETLAAGIVRGLRGEAPVPREQVPTLSQELSALKRKGGGPANS